MLTATPEANSYSSRLTSALKERFVRAASRTVAADSVAAFRIFFGLLVAFGSARFLFNGWVGSLYLEPANHLTYRGFGWVSPLPSPFMHLHVAALALLGLAIAAGYRHRLSTGLFVVGFAYTELLEASLYLNHYWFVTVAALSLWLLPVQHRWSLDVRAGRVAAYGLVPAWVVWALRTQLGFVYVFAGIAKLNVDWLVHAQPMGIWLADRTDVALLGSLFTEPFVGYFVSWLAVVFDCTIVGWLLWRRSRPLAYLVLVAFHLVTGLLFQIGVFPWLMILATLVFFDPDWPQRLLHRVNFKPSVFEPSVGAHGAGVAAGSIARVGRGALLALAVFGVVQVALPLRHYFADGNVRWNEVGYYLSWRVMLTEKAGFVEYEITDPASGDVWEVGPELVLADWQASHAATRPDLIHATALLLVDYYAARGVEGVEVRADAWVSMNGRPAARLIEPSVDLAAHSRGSVRAGWILPNTGLSSAGLVTGE